MASRIIRKGRSSAKLNKSMHIVVVTKSNKNMLAQVLEPKTLRPLFTSNSYKMTGTKTEKSVKVGAEIAKFLNTNKVEEIGFNRNGFLYHGRVKALAETVRDNNIKF